MSGLAHEPDRVRRDKWNGLVGLFTVGRVLTALAALFVLLFAIGWILREDPFDKPYLTILAAASSSITACRTSSTASRRRSKNRSPPARSSRSASRIGRRPAFGRREARERALRALFLQFAERGRRRGRKAYHVVVRIYDRRREELIWTKELDFESQVSDDIMPEKPLIVGPGYTPNPDL